MAWRERVEGQQRVVARRVGADGALVAWRNSASTPINRTEARLVRADGTLGALILPTEGPGIIGPASPPARGRRAPGGRTRA